MTTTTTTDLSSSSSNSRLLQLITAGNDIDANKSGITVLIILWIIGLVVLILLVLAGISNYTTIKRLDANIAAASSSNNNNNNNADGDGDEDDNSNASPPPPAEREKQDFNYVSYLLLLSPFATSIVAIVFGIMIQFSCNYVEIEEKSTNPPNLLTSIGIWSVAIPGDDDENNCYNPKELDESSFVVEDGGEYNPDFIMIIVRVVSLISAGLGFIGILGYWYYIFAVMNSVYPLKLLKFMTWCLAGIFGWSGFFQAVTLITHATNYCFDSERVHGNGFTDVECLTAFDGYAATTSAFYYFLAGLSLFLLWFSPVY